MDHHSFFGSVSFFCAGALPLVSQAALFAPPPPQPYIGGEPPAVVAPAPQNDTVARTWLERLMGPPVRIERGPKPPPQLPTPTPAPPPEPSIIMWPINFPAHIYRFHGALSPNGVPTFASYYRYCVSVDCSLHPGQGPLYTGMQVVRSHYNFQSIARNNEFIIVEVKATNPGYNLLVYGQDGRNQTIAGLVSFYFAIYTHRPLQFEGATPLNPFLIGVAFGDDQHQAQVFQKLTTAIFFPQVPSSLGQGVPYYTVSNNALVQCEYPNNPGPNLSGHPFGHYTSCRTVL